MSPRNPDFAKAVAEGFARQGMMTTLGAELIEVAHGRCVIAAPITPELSQQAGSAHAGLAFSLGDSAAGFAALSTLEPGMDVVTVEMKIQLLAPAIGERLVAEGSVMRAGQRIVSAEASVFAEEARKRTRVAYLTGTMLPVSRQH